MGEGEPRGTSQSDQVVSATHGLDDETRSFLDAFILYGGYRLDRLFDATKSIKGLDQDKILELEANVSEDDMMAETETEEVKALDNYMRPFTDVASIFEEGSADEIYACAVVLIQEGIAAGKIQDAWTVAQALRLKDQMASLTPAMDDLRAKHNAAAAEKRAKDDAARKEATEAAKQIQEERDLHSLTVMKKMSVRIALFEKYFGPDITIKPGAKMETFRQEYETLKVVQIYNEKGFDELIRFLIKHPKKFATLEEDTRIIFHAKIVKRIKDTLAERFASYRARVFVEQGLAAGMLDFERDEALIDQATK